MNVLDKQRNNQKKNIFSQTDWIEKALVYPIEAACQEFWEDRYEFIFQSLTESSSVKNDLATRRELFFAKKFDVGQSRTVVVRFSSNFVRVFLHAYLASSSPQFDLSKLSELEAKVFNSFAQFIFDKIKTHFIDYNALSSADKTVKGNLNLTLCVRKGVFPSGKISLTLPKNLISLKELNIKENFTLDDFLQSSTMVKLKAGTTRITLNELKSLSKDDILLLENSSINAMKIKTKNVESTFKVSPDPTLILDLDENELKNFEGDNMVKNVWDDIQIEVSAEFNKVKMTLGELKQLTSGMVIDLGDIFDNKISLVVEDKVVAKGNLIIINDKYGVKIDEIISDNDEIKNDVVKTNINNSNAQARTPKPQTQPAAKPIESVEAADIETDEDFDYSNVEEGE